MSDWGENFAQGLIASFVATVIFEVFISSSIISLQQSELKTVAGGLLATRLTRVPILTLIFAVPAYYAVNYIAKQTYRAVERRNNIHRKNQPSAFVIGSGPPESIIWAGQIEKYGVIWPASYGHNVGRTGFEHGKPYLYIHQPCCPSCHTEMLHRTVPKWVFSEKKVWRCPDCSEMVERPREMMYEEKQGVEKIVDREITQLANNEGRIQSSDPFSDNKKIITEVWNPN